MTTIGVRRLAVFVGCLTACGSAAPASSTGPSTADAGGPAADNKGPAAMSSPARVTSGAAGSGGSRSTPSVSTTSSSTASAGRPAAGSAGNASAGSAGNASAGSAGNGAAGSSNGAAGSAGTMSAAGAAASAAGSGGTQSSASTGTLPAINDPIEPGPYMTVEQDNVGPMNAYTTIQPRDLGVEGVKNPILIWGPGAGSTPAIYQELLDHIASHGFVIVAYNQTPDGPELNRAIDWIVEEAGKDGSPYFNKVDTMKIAMGGQSAGSLATYVAGKDERLTTTVHINGGTFNHDDVKNLIRPAFFVCGDDPMVTGGDGTWESDLARPNCDADFMNAKVPVWYGVVIGSSHTTVIDNPLEQTPAAQVPLKKQYLGATVAWLRWQLAGDEVMKERFVGQSCGYCTQPMLWQVMQKDLK